MRATPESLQALLRAYLVRFGSHGYDAETFIDWCVVGVGHARDSSSGLIEFYQKRLTALRAEWAGVIATVPGRCRQFVTDNYGELVELWDCAEGEERIELEECGRVRLYRVPSGMRSESYHWTPEGRELVLELRARARAQAKGAG